MRSVALTLGLLATTIGAEPALPAVQPVAPAAVAPLAAVPEAAPKVAGPVPFVASYRMVRDGTHIADARFELARDGEDGWTFSSETSAAGLIAIFYRDVIAEHSAFRMGSERPIPLAYRYEHRGSSKDRDARYGFDWQRERLTGVYRGKPVDLPLARGLLDPLTLRLAVGYDLARGTLQPSYSVIERRKLQEYRLAALPPQRIRIAAGEFEVRGVVRSSADGTKTTRFLYAPALDWAPVLLEQSETDEATYRLELVSFTRR